MSLANEEYKDLILKKKISSENSLTVSTEEAAEMLGVCPRTVRNLTKRGELPVIRIAACVRYSREVLIEFVRQGSKRETSHGKELTDFTPGLGEVA